MDGKKKWMLPHRVAYEQHVGPIPSDTRLTTYASTETALNRLTGSRNRQREHTPFAWMGRWKVSTRPRPAGNG